MKKIAPKGDLFVFWIYFSFTKGSLKKKGGRFLICNPNQGGPRGFKKI